MYLRTSPDFTGQYDKDYGAADKSKALAPTYPPMRNSDLRSSGELVRLEKSPSEDADISGKGADDHIGFCLSIELGVSE